MNDRHKPVLCEETIELVMPEEEPRNTFVDATFGRGGHSLALLARLASQARVIAIDRDPDAVAAGAAIAAGDARLTICHARFSELSAVLEAQGVAEVDGVIMDLGVSSPQLDSAERGFSFRHAGPLDMRMDPSRGVSAAQWLNAVPEAEIAQVLRDFGEERHARRIARAIVAARPLETTVELTAVIEAAQPPQRDRARHPATRSFQAIRIAVNEELDELDAGLQAGFAQLRPGGRLAAISFHSLEDRVVKRAFRALADPGRLPRRLPVRASEHTPVARLVAGPLRAGDAEVAENPRARSATLRVLERLR